MKKASALIMASACLMAASSVQAALHLTQAPSGETGLAAVADTIPCIIAGDRVYQGYNLTAGPIAATGDLSFVGMGDTAGTPLVFEGKGLALPEPTTMIAGALMLLPFAAGGLKMRRKVEA